MNVNPALFLAYGYVCVVAGAVAGFILGRVT